MSNFEDAVIQRIKQLEREVERLQKWERPDKTGWIPVSDTWTYASATSFKITGKDVRYKFPKGTKIKLVQSGITKYFYVTATAYSADTTVTVTGGSDYNLANATISGQAYSYAASPQVFPEYFNHTITTYSGWSAAPTGTFLFKLIGNLVVFFMLMDGGNSNGTAAVINLPCVTTNPVIHGVLGYAVDNGIPLINPAKWAVAGDRLEMFSKMDWSGWTASGLKFMIGTIEYPI